jgi:hypothetical protein
MDLETSFALEIYLLDIERSAVASEVERYRKACELFAQIDSEIRYAQNLVDRTQPIIDRAQEFIDRMRNEDILHEQA